MSGRNGAFAFACFALGTFCFVSLFPLFRFQSERYRREEPFYGSPLPAPRGILFLRNDVYGKGHFGASRNKGRRHHGVDFLAPIGTAVYAPKSGRVLRAGQDKG